MYGWKDILSKEGLSKPPPINKCIVFSKSHTELLWNKIFLDWVCYRNWLNFVKVFEQPLINPYWVWTNCLWQIVWLHQTSSQWWPKPLFIGQYNLLSVEFWNHGGNIKPSTLLWFKDSFHQWVEILILLNCGPFFPVTVLQIRIGTWAYHIKAWNPRSRTWLHVQIRNII